MAFVQCVFILVPYLKRLNYFMVKKLLFVLLLAFRQERIPLLLNFMKPKKPLKMVPKNLMLCSI
ncbi:hypothetical protein CY0110_19742 [Crocosphaera chwakensis CCY0110]|uniref:Uncharacterized protein n=1 Tax=Crocosphaera chwakensis CCY0110 TaxID=391612 RepID=A3IJT0_9CHRO|nr:hypothetical protein CY0110_19742 [Crocosphaera chwakensis CCY0110]